MEQKYRSRGSLVSSQDIRQEYQLVTLKKNAATVTDNTVTNVKTYYLTGRLMTDVVTPRFSEASHKGRIINNPMWLTDGKVDTLPYSGPESRSTRPSAALPNGSSYDITGTITNLVHLPGDVNFQAIPDLFVDYSHVINSAFSGAHQRDVMGIVDFAERRKTADLLKTNLNRLSGRSLASPLKSYKKVGKGVRVLKYKSPNKAMWDTVKGLSNLYLEYRYGLVPLMASIEGIVKQFTYDSSLLPVRQTFREKERTFDQDTNVVVVPTVVGQPGAGSLTYTVERTQEIMVRAGVMTEFKPTLNQRLGLDAANLITAGVELIPYSFVLDWWLNLGTYLDAVIPQKGFDYKASWLSTERRSITTYTASRSGGSYTAGGWTYTFSPYLTRVIVTSMQKQRIPGVTPRIPHPDTHYRKTKHLLDAIALVVSSANRKHIARI